MKSNNKASLSCMKVVPYHELIALRNTLEQLESWTETLEILARFFQQANQQSHKKKIIKDYHASSKLFQLFQQDYQELLTKAQIQLRSVNKEQHLLTTKVVVDTSRSKESDESL